MIINQITGNASAVPSANVTSGGGISKFNRLLSEEVSGASTHEHASVTGSGASPDSGSLELKETGPVKVGTVTSEIPTVSDLLIQNPDLKKECWNIIFSKENRDKAYTSIPEGTDIYYDPTTRELLWGDMMAEFQEKPGTASPSKEHGTNRTRTVLSSTNSTGGPPLSTAGPEAGAERSSGSLVDAVEPLIGSAYSEMNCYELLVNGLGRMGVRYYGREGLGHQMMSGAIKNGLPMNAYLNGEGLVHFSGSETYRKVFIRVSDPVEQSRRVFDEMLPQLEKGSILSFSAESRGHAGVVSNRNGVWTYINSGVMDNSVEEMDIAKGVGEEQLDKEIENWLRLAARENESLVITLGKLNQNKLAAYGVDGKATVL